MVDAPREMFCGFSSIEAVRDVFMRLLASISSNDNSGAYENDFVDAAAALEHFQPAEYGRLTINLKARGIALGRWERVVRERIRQERERLATAARATQQSSLSAPGALPYTATSSGIVWQRPTSEGVAPTALTNFNATITADIELDDGAEVRHRFQVDAQIKGRTRRFEVAAKDFFGMRWVPELLGANAVVYAGAGTADHARVAIHLLSPSPIPHRRVYAHSGWTRLPEGGLVFLHHGGGIGDKGLRDDVETELPQNLRHLWFREIPTGEKLIAAIGASLSVLDLGPFSVTAAPYCAVWRAVLGVVVDFSLHLSGPTGEFKTEFAALLQAHQGRSFNSRHLPAEWADTAYALERIGYLAKDTLMVIDDLAPGANAMDRERVQRDAARFFRAVGNHAGRMRMNSDTTLRISKPPRCLPLSTGEDMMRGHSVRGRSLIGEVAPGAIDQKRLTACQHDAADGLYEEAMAAFLVWVAQHFDEIQRDFPGLVQAYRDDARQGAGEHRRTPGIVADLFAGLKFFLRFAVEAGALTELQSQELHEQIWESLLDLAGRQAELQEDQEPAGMYPARCGYHLRRRARIRSRRTTAARC